jgi:hypothetical protein
MKTMKQIAHLVAHYVSRLQQIRLAELITNLSKITRRLLLLGGALSTVLGFSLVGSIVYAKSSTSVSGSSTSSSSSSEIKLQLIITRGNEEITRRLTTLNTLSSRISATDKLSASDKSSLEAEVTTEIGGLTTLKTELDGSTTVTEAGTYAQDIISEYRVYALIVPKVFLIKTADDQQIVQAKLTSLAGDLQTRITADQTAGKNVTTLQADLTLLNTTLTSAESISSSVESSVLPLQPSDYDADQTILTQYYGQLKTAHGDDQTCYNQAKTIVTGLEAL